MRSASARREADHATPHTDKTDRASLAEPPVNMRLLSSQAGRAVSVPGYGLALWRADEQPGGVENGTSSPPAW